MKLLKSALLIAVLSSSFSFAESSLASTDIFLKLDSIPGESTSVNHPGQIDILAYSQSVQRANTGAVGANAQGKAICGQISIQKLLDKSSPFLLAEIFTGHHIPSGQVYFDKAGAGQNQDYYQVTLTDIAVTSIQQSDSSNSSVVESVALSAAKIEIDYRPQKADGTLGAPEKLTIDCAAGGRVY